ncbi:MAG: type VI secretion system baseplate subunit TssF [Tannerellaceae bacterium]|nr:type VI secretion system baseplate subunit TssF [Tannerellaceae bacterium]
MKGNNYTKEGIRNRMLKRMAALWEIRNIDTIDPLVKLLIEALAGEIFRLSGEMNDIETRIIEKVASALTPDPMLSVQPAHAILHARVKQGDKIIDPLCQFIYKDAAFSRKYQIKRLDFYPLFPVRIINGDTTHMIYKGEAHSLHVKQGKDYEAKSLHADPRLNHTVWLALDIEEDIQNLQGIPFYFDFSQAEDVSEYLPLIPYTRWQIAGQTIEMESGLPVSGNTALLPETLPAGEQDSNHLVNRLLAEYNPVFLTIKNEVPVKDIPRETFPQILRNLFPEEYIAGFTKPVYWIEIQFPPGFSVDIIQQLQIHINAFPVVNRFPKKITHEITPATTIIPLAKLETEYLMSVEEVTDSEGLKYAAIAGPDKEKYAGGTFALRRGGCERFNKQDATGSLLRLIDLLYDESVAFSSIDQDSLKENINELLAQISRLSQRIRPQERTQESLSYLMIDRRKNDLENTHMFVNYWLTNGKLANGIPPATSISYPDENDLVNDTLCLLTTTRGGKEAPEMAQKLDLYKYALLSHDSVYTREDILNFCRAHYGEYIRNISLQPGYAPGKLPGQGIIRTLDIHITSSAACREINTDELATHIRCNLASRSPGTFNYRVFIN